MQDFWNDCGYRHLTRNDHGWLRVTPDWLRHVLMRPELAPLDESGPGERAFHARLCDDPLWHGAETALGEIEDADTRANFAHFLRFRRALADAVTLERFYLTQFRRGMIDLPPALLDLTAQTIVRDLLDGCDDPVRVRAGELFFRRQRVSTEDNRVLSADAEAIQLFAETGGFGSIGRLLQQQGTPLRDMQLHILGRDNAPFYWFAENRFRFVLDLTPGGEASAALAELMARWIGRFLGVETDIASVPRIDDPAWRWHLGLDTQSTAILNALYRGETIDESQLGRLIGLFRLMFRQPADARPEVQGKPVYLGLAIDEDHLLKLKPQNLLLNLPIARGT